MSGLVYYVLDATRTTQYVKIGHTTSLLQRLAKLRRETLSRQTPIVLALEEGHREREQGQHRRYADLHHVGEWFHYRDELRDYIAGLDDPVTFIQDRSHLWGMAKGWAGVPDIRLRPDPAGLPAFNTSDF